ncbi:PDDEXK-like family protein [Sulfurimonas sp.]
MEKMSHLLEIATQYFPSENEKTIFSIGGRGFYENPISDVLAFFLDSQEVHGFGTLFVDSFFDSMNYSIENTGTINPPLREVSTLNNNRIDLLIEGEDWVLIIENKIYHTQNNPFGDYEKYIDEKYPNKKLIFTILSPSGNSTKSNWKGISYKELIASIKENKKQAMDLSQKNYSKWMVYLEDFILNLEQYAVRNSMDQSTVEFIENNYQDITNIAKLQDKYHNHVKVQGKKLLISSFPNNKFSDTIHNWGHGPALRYYSEQWHSKSNIVIQISHRDKDKGLGIYIYVYGATESNIYEIDKILTVDYEGSLWTESKTIRCYKSNKRYVNFDNIEEEFIDAAIRLKKIEKIQ